MPCRPLLSLLVLAVAMRNGPTQLAVADELPALRTASSVLALSAGEAGKKRKVSVTGVVTAAEPDWKNQFFVQDETGGIFVENLNQPAPQPGDLVAVEGVTHPGAFAPIISLPSWRKIGTRSLPEAKQVSIEDLKTGAEDSQRVEISGVVRTAEIENGRLLMDLVVVGNRLEVHARLPKGLSPGSLVAARVRVRGTAATQYIGALRHLASVAVYSPRLEDFTIVEAERSSPFEEPVIPVNSVAQYRPGVGAEKRLHVSGIATLQRVGEAVFLQDSSGGIRVETRQKGEFTAGTRIEAAGFLEYENNLPVLRDFVVRPLVGPPIPILPKRVSFEEVASGQHHGELITLRGRILDIDVRPYFAADGTSHGFVTTWLLEGKKMSYTLEDVSADTNSALASIPVGSLVDSDGVCISSVDTLGKLTSLKVMLAGANALRVVEKPSWLTPGRLMAGLAIVGIGLVVALGWLLTVSKKNAILRKVVAELEKAQKELQEAHDTLEEKVEERSAQLKVEITARKTDELQFKAVLAERTRLARDLHDTLEQTLAGIALRLNTASRLSKNEPESASAHLQIARNLLHQSQGGLRRSIWDLRSRELEEFDLASALRRSAEQLVSSVGAQLEFSSSGNYDGLPEVVEENILRVGQEALTNVGKHAQASKVSVTLSFSERLLSLEIRDNGLGFEKERDAKDGHFGLIGISERTKRLSGVLTVESNPGQGTMIRVEIPLGGLLATAQPRLSDTHE